MIFTSCLNPLASRPYTSESEKIRSRFTPFFFFCDKYVLRKDNPIRIRCLIAYNTSQRVGVGDKISLGVYNVGGLISKNKFEKKNVGIGSLNTEVFIKRFA